MPSNEEKGLIRSQRLHNGYRDYDESVVKQVQTIQLYFHLGLNTEQIKTIVDCDPFRFPHEQLLWYVGCRIFSLRDIDDRQNLVFFDSWDFFCGGCRCG